MKEDLSEGNPPQLRKTRTARSPAETLPGSISAKLKSSRTDARHGQSFEREGYSILMVLVWRPQTYF
jgi:hypothetical protein